MRGVRQSEDTEETVPKERTKQNARIELNEREISSIPDKEFKVIVIHTLKTGERRVDDLRGNVNKVIGNI